MFKYVIKRVLSAIPTLFIVLTLVFIMMRMVPGNPLYAIMGDQELTVEQMEELKTEYGFNDPIWKQYVRYLKDIVSGNWGVSYINGRSVFANIVERWEPTILLGLMSMVIFLGIGIPVGIIAATHRNSLLDYALSTTSIVFLAMPTFWLGVLMVYLFGFKLQWFPIQGYRYIAKGGLLNSLKYLVLPAVAQGMTHVASIARQTRSSMLGVLHEDYIRTAKAKGLPKKSILYKHSLKNALSVISTMIGNSVAALLGGSTVVERVFNIQGVGKLALTSLNTRDYPQEQAIVLISAFMFIFVNILQDIIYKVIDPRIDYSK